MDAYGHLRPLTLADVLDGIFRLLKDHWRAFLLAVGGVLVPLTLASSLILAAVAPNLLTPDFQALFDPEQLDAAGPLFDSGEVVGLLVSMALALFVTFPLTYAVCAKVAGDAVTTTSSDPAEAVRHGLRRWPAVLGLIVLQVVALLLALVAIGILIALTVATIGGVVGAIVAIPLIFGLITVGAWLLTRWSLAIPVAVIENSGAVTALRRSWGLTRTRFWWLFGTLLLVQIIGVIVSGIAQVPFQLAIFVPGSAFLRTLIVSFGSVIGGLLSTPITVNALVLLYSDRRVRVEGVDLLEPTRRLS